MATPVAGEDPWGASFRGLGFLIAAMAALIFVPAWSLTFWQGWLYLAVFAASTAAITVYFLARDPDLIRRRLSAGAGAETEPRQKIIQGVASGCFVAVFVVSALDHRFAWSSIRPGASVTADVIAALGFLGVFLTFRENSFASATIQVEPQQGVIATGPYAIVRHPMYATAGVMILATPIALGSWWALIPAVLLIVAIVARLLDEERFLILNLPGYARYLRQTRFRLVPGVW